MQTLECTAQGKDVCLSKEHLKSKYGHVEGNKGLELVAGDRLGLTPKRKPWRAGFPQLPTSCSAQFLPSWERPGSASVIQLGVQPAVKMRGDIAGAPGQIGWELCCSSRACQALLPERSAWKSACRELRELREWGLGSYPIHSVWSYPIHTQRWCWWSSVSMGSSPPHCGSGVGWDGWRAENSWGRASSSPLSFSVLVWSADAAACWWAHSQKIEGFPDCNPALPLSASLCPIPHLWLGNSNGSASLSRCSSSGVQVPSEVVIFIACKGEEGFSPSLKQREIACFLISKHMVVPTCPRNYCGVFIKDVFHKFW